MATDQASKLGLGKNQSIVCMFSNYQVRCCCMNMLCTRHSESIRFISFFDFNFFGLQIIQLNKLPLIVTFIGTENCNTGHVLALGDQIDSYLDEIKQTVTEA